MTPRRSRCIVALLAVLGSTPVLAQPPRPMSDVLLKRLAEAVDGARRDSAVWVVASWDSVPRVAGVFTSANAARAAANGLGAQFASFGPYASSVRSTTSEIACWHINPSDLRCGIDTSAALSVAGVEFVMSDGSRRRVANDVDAVFLTRSAIDKFVVPYYVRVLGIDRAQRLRDSLLARRP